MASVPAFAAVFSTTIHRLPRVRHTITPIDRRRAVRVRSCVHSYNSSDSEPPFFRSIRDAAPTVLSPRGLGIASMEMSDTRLCIYVSTLDDINDLPDASAASLDDCAYASSVLGELLDSHDLVPSASYTLEVSTPGTTDVLTKQREFLAFQGFEVTVRTKETFKNETQFKGTLQERTKQDLRINIKGRVLSIPREIVSEVSLGAAKEE